MTTSMWIALGVLALFVIGVIGNTRAMMRKSRELEKEIDYSKVRRWKEDDEPS